MRKYTKIPEDAFNHIARNAGVIAKSFVPTTGVVTDILGATTGGITFTDAPEYTDYGEDIDNVPANMMELQEITSRTVTLGSTYVSVTEELAKNLAAAADLTTESSASKITPRDVLKTEDFEDIWWITDYSAEDGGFFAIHLKRALNKAGLSVVSSKNGKGNFAFTYTGHYTMQDVDDVPYEIYIGKATA